MKKLLTLALLLTSSLLVHSQQLLTWSPSFPADNASVTITVDATQGNKGLMGFTGTVYMHLGVITNLSKSPTDWRYVTTTWASTTAPTAINLGSNKWLFSISNPRTYFNVPAGETILQIALLFRNASGSLIQKNTDGGDLKVPIYATGSNYITFTNPTIVPENYPLSHTPITAGIGQSVPLTALASTSAGTLNLYFNGTKVAGPVTGTNTITGSVSATAYGNQQIVAEVVVGGVSSYDTLNYFISPTTQVAALPSSVVINNVPHEGINYYGCSDSVTLVLYAPNKTSSVVVGDFPGSNWLPQLQNQMYKTPDGLYYWITLHGLTAGTEYSFQYFVDNSIYIGDPYAEKFLDGSNDRYIPASTYPNLKAYPTSSNVSTGKNGLISILQTCAPQYTWKTNKFTPPDKKNLVIEEVLVRDFASVNGTGNFKLLTDSINYFKRLGINAIELMPVSEFSGNDSWGYNPNFYCALDKAYGTKDMYKTFIDSCHANGIAVIMDVVYNQIDDYGIQVPEAKLYWDATNNRPAANNPWLNIAAPHPYSVFDDLNHTSTATQYWVERSLNYWLTEFHVDGFRFDLAKGFTQKCTQISAMCSSTSGSVEDYDASRVANLERYYDYVNNNHPGSTMPYMILEFLAGSTPSAEEKTYTDYGFMVWAEIGSNGSPTQTAWDQNTMGYTGNSNLSRSIYNSSDQGFAVPGSVDYMASHDDQRPMFTTENYGNGAAVKSVSGVGGALQRQAAMAAILFNAPGPHMFYEFDERGNDTSQSANGSNTSYKNPLWYYLTTDPNAAARRACVDAYSKLINLRVSNTSLFNSPGFAYDLYDGGGLFRRFQASDTGVSQMKLTVIANFDITAQTRSITFQAAGNWYNYLSDGTGSGINGATGTTFNLASATQSVTLHPGEYHVYLYQPANIYTFIGDGNWSNASNWLYGSVPPATLPSGSQVFIQPKPGGICNLDVQQTISSGAGLTVITGKILSLPGNLTIQ